MNYELAKQLKEAGFPQKTLNTGVTVINKDNVISVITETNPEIISCLGNFGWIYAPTLSELIEACPKKILNKDTEDTKYSYFCLEIDTDDSRDEPEKEIWVAGYNTPIDYEGNFITMSNNGSTPEEAVARLWLELNKK